MKSFKDYPDFKPNLTPKEVFKMGSFGGTYFRPIKSSVTGKSYKSEIILYVHTFSLLNGTYRCMKLRFTTLYRKCCAYKCCVIRCPASQTHINRQRNELNEALLSNNRVRES